MTLAPPRTRPPLDRSPPPPFTSNPTPSGGHMVIACWCQREETPEKPLSPEDKEKLRFLYEEWAHPYFISIQEFCRLMDVSEGRGRGGWVGGWVEGLGCGLNRLATAAAKPAAAGALPSELSRSLKCLGC
jgi:hypothetical protein